MATAADPDDVRPADATRPVRGAGAAGWLIVALLGDYWYASTEFVPSSALVALTGEFGTTEVATRAALSRLARDGALEGTRSGRTTAYRLSPDLVDRARVAGRELLQVGAEPRPWDGRWTCVAFSLRGSDGRRRALRRRLRRLGLGPVVDDVWITPCAALEPVRRAVAGLGAGEVVVLRAAEVAVPTGVDLLSAWDLDGLRAGYDALVASLARLQARLDDGAVGAAEALVARTQLVVDWRELVATDPRLPDELLPDGWPRRAAHRGFVGAYDALGPLAELRARQLVGDRVGASSQPRHHRAADIV
jgi:phenylacetic acid degradation operon negative regulatory protein